MNTLAKFWGYQSQMGILLLSLLCFGCVDGTVNKPEAPNVDVEQRQITNPEGGIDQSNIGSVASGTQRTLDVLAPACGWDVLPMFDCEGSDCEAKECDLVELVKGLLVVAAMFVAEDDLETDPNDPNPPPEDVPSSSEYINSAEGFGVITRICSGYGSGVRNDPANGNLELNIGFTNYGLDSTVWGVFNACRYTTDSWGDVSIDGNIVVRTERKPKKANSDQLFIVADLAISGFGIEKKIFAVFQDDETTKTTRIYIPTSGGVVFFRSPTAVGFVDKLGRIDCDFSAQTCTRDTSEVFEW